MIIISFETLSVFSVFNMTYSVSDVLNNLKSRVFFLSTRDFCSTEVLAYRLGLSHCSVFGTN